MPSPLANTFHVPLHPFEPGQVDDAAEGPRGHGRRHSRMHSRNLSLFFPRPHATISEDLPSDIESAPNNNPQSKTDLHIPASQSEPFQIGHDRTASFSFGSSGSMPKSDSAGAVPAGVTARRGHHHKHSLSHNFFSFLDPARQPQPEAKSEELHTAPTPAPMSPWSPVSNVQSGESASSSKVDLTTGTSSRSSSASPAPSQLPYHYLNLSKDGLLARVACILQLCLGGLVWVRGQAIGSLACTGLGYWVVFDAFGIAVGGPLLGRSKGGFGPARTQTTLLFAQCVYLMFAGVYVAKEAVEHILLSAGHGHGHGHGHPSPSPPSAASTASVLALNASLNAAGGITRGLGLHGAGEMGNDGHHHHWGDERPEMLGLRYPLGLIIIVLLSLLATSTVFEHHDVLVRVTNKHIHFPSPLSLFQRSRLHPSSLVPGRGQVQAPWERILRNPYALLPILFCVAILGGEMVLNVAHYTPFDLSLATLQVIITTHVAYAACIVLGGVLLQTAPAASFAMSVGGIGTKSMGGMSGINMGMTGVKGMASAKGTNNLESKMESFWRVVREIERHEHVMSLPAPHVWQVCPPGQGDTKSFGLRSAPRSALSPSDSSSPFPDTPRGPEPQLIITLSPHVPPSLRDEEVLKFTRWACERVKGAFVGDGVKGGGVEVEVCVGILRG